MRRYVVPLLLFSAVGAVVVVLVLANREKKSVAPVVKKEPPKQEPKTPAEGRLKPATTRTKLQEHRALRELERLLQREKLDPKAHYYRQKVCEQMDEILESEKLTRNLLDAIKEHGINSDDPERRKLLLPILRVLDHPEATRMIEEEYFRARDVEEALVLLEAMAHKHHSPEKASVWAIDRALNGETEEHRRRAFHAIRAYSDDNAVMFETAEAIHSGTTRPRQANEMLETIVYVAGAVKDAQQWLREKLDRPRPDEIGHLIAYMETWATQDDAANLERLAVSFPAMGDILRQRAEEVRLALALKTGDQDTIEKAQRAKEEREKQREAERRKAAEEAAEKDG